MIDGHSWHRLCFTNSQNPEHVERRARVEAYQSQYFVREQQIIRTPCCKLNIFVFYIFQFMNNFPIQFSSDSPSTGPSTSTSPTRPLRQPLVLGSCERLNGRKTESEQWTPKATERAQRSHRSTTAGIAPHPQCVGMARRKFLVRDFSSINIMSRCSSCRSC